MSEKPEKFDFYSPVLSTDVVKEAPAIPDYNQPQLTPNQNKVIIKKANKEKKKEKFELPRKVETPEEIEAWIAERRRKYPTRVKIAEKEQTQQEREQRGALDLSQPIAKSKKQKDKSNKPIEMSTVYPTKIPSLLDQMCSDQVRADHSIILQCFRYFVQHNFLQDPADTQ